MIEVVFAWSGGKDSALALAALRADPRYRVVALLTTVTRDYDRISIHGVRRSVLEAQVRALGLPLVEASIAPGASNADYEAAFGLALRAAQERWPGLRHIAFGDLYLADVRAYREVLLASLDWAGIFPLWGEDTAALARRFVRAGYGRSSRASIRPSLVRNSLGGSLTRRSWRSCRRRWIRAGNAANSTPVCMPGRSSRARCH